MIQLRPYQELARADSIRWLDNYEGPGIVVAPTAWGKSVLIASLAHYYGNMLVFQPSKELLAQNFKKYSNFSDDGCIYSASFKTKEHGNVTFATLGSVKSKPEDFAHYEYLLVDECHTFPTDDSMYSGFIKANPNLKVLGLTATPFRLERGIMGAKLFSLDSRKYNWNGFAHICQIQDILPWWCPIEYTDLHGDQSLLKLNTTGSEYTEKSVVAYSRTLDSRIREVLDTLSDPTLIFVPSIDQANSMARKFNGRAISAKTKPKDRDGIMDWFNEGNGHLFNVNMLGIGYDKPDLVNIIDANPTMSLSRYYQRVGRLTRQHPSKSLAHYYDLSGNYLRFGRVEDLVIRKQKRSTHVFSGDIQLSGVYLDQLPNVVGFEPSNEVIMPFGKYKGQPVSSVPMDYLNWGLEVGAFHGPVLAAVTKKIHE